MAAYVPTEFMKDGVKETATTWKDHFQYIWDGWTPVTDAIPTPKSGAATQQDLRRLQGELRRQAILTSPSSPKLGPVTTDFTAVNVNITPNGAIYNRQYVMSNMSPVTGSVPAAWPCDMGEGIAAYSAGYHFAYASWQAIPRSMRVMCDGNGFVWYQNGANTLNDFMVYVDGRPTSLTPYTGGPAAVPHFNEITFPTNKVRQIEIRTSAGILAVYTKKPYTLWRPQPVRGPRVLVMGDSFTSSMSATKSMSAMYWNIGPWIGSDDVWVDHYGGTGYGVHNTTNGTDVPAAGPNRYLDRLYHDYGNGAIWDVKAINPDMVVVHGGGANDNYKGRTNAQIIADVVLHFQNLRRKLPNARLVFIEGFAPPLAGFSDNNPAYIAIRQGAQAALQSVGVYYVDVATTDPWIKGTGYAGTGDATENSYAYISADQVHPNDAGHEYIKARLAPKLRRILADDGTLLNTLI